MLTLSDWMELYPDQTWLPILPEDTAAAWERAIARPHSNPRARERAYHNYLSLQVFQRWLRDQDFSQPVSQPLPEQQLPARLEFVNGIPLHLGPTRLVLIPEIALNLEELRVPQEWVDIPNWAAAYYVSLQLELNSEASDQQGLGILGYTAHAHLKTAATWDAGDRTYVLPTTRLISDLTVLLVTQHLSPAPAPTVAPLPALAPAAVPAALSQLSQPSLYSPRLSLPWETWGPLLAHSGWQEQLYQQRVSARQQESRLEAIAPTPRPRINLYNWTRGVVTAAWTLLDTLSIPDSPLAPALARRGEPGQADSVASRTQFALGDQCFQLTVFVDVEPPTHPEAPLQIGVWLRVERVETTLPLPAGFKMTVSYQDSQSGEFMDLFERELFSGSVVRSVQTSKMVALADEVFSVTLSLIHESVTEEFFFKDFPNPE